MGEGQRGEGVGGQTIYTFEKGGFAIRNARKGWPVIAIKSRSHNIKE